MICPQCQRMVDPVTSNRWLEILADREDLDSPPDAMTVLSAVYAWDQSAMLFKVGGRFGQSVLPTELRDAVAGLVNG